jgi:hypothetical protein
VACSRGGGPRSRRWRSGWPSPDPGEQEAEIERILALGARRVDIGQTGAESWTALADPEGNEFCVVRPKRTLISATVRSWNPGDRAKPTS